MEPFMKRSPWDILQLILALCLIAAAPALIIGSLCYLGRAMPPGQSLVWPELQDEAPPPADPSGDAATERKPIEVFGNVPNEYPAAVRMTALQTVPVSAGFANGQTGFGTGFLYRQGIVVTAAHILDSQGYEDLRLVTVFCDGRNTAGRTLGFDRLRDVAVIAADCAAKRLTLDTRRPRAARKLFVTGFTYRASRTAVDRFLKPAWARPRALLTDRGPELGDPRINLRIREIARLGIPRYRAIDALTVPGNSGSPVVNAAGQVVGMSVIIDPTLGVTFITPAVNIRYVLDKAGVR